MTVLPLRRSGVIAALALLPAVIASAETLSVTRVNDAIIPACRPTEAPPPASCPAATMDLPLDRSEWRRGAARPRDAAGAGHPRRHAAHLGRRQDHRGDGVVGR